MTHCASSGIRAVQAGALTDALTADCPKRIRKWSTIGAPPLFRALAREVGESGAALAHRYALSMPGVATVILRIKNRVELRECLAAAERGPLDPGLIGRIDAATGRP
jgi:aryl-alcohol dehydrogenase-like predicted oxidoreductase